MTLSWLRPIYWVIALSLLSAIGVASNYLRLSETDDELFHIDCGTEWWQDGSYTIQPMHPPFARIVDAALPFVFNVEKPVWGTRESFRASYMFNMLLSRLGVLPFYLFSCWLVFAWSRDLFGASAGLASLLLYALLPTVTAHAALATTDMVYTTMMLWALRSSCNWLQKPTAKTSLPMGVSIALACCSKFSALAQFPASMALVGIVQLLASIKNRLPLPVSRAHVISAIIVALPVFAYVVGMVYRFAFDSLWAGLATAKGLNTIGYGVWFYGPFTGQGSPWFFPAVFFFKTPLPFFAALCIAAYCIIYNIWRGGNVQQLFPILASAGILGVSMTSNINLGVRHVLILYPLLAIPAGYGLSELWRGHMHRRALAAALVLWQLWGYAGSYPEPIAYFNEIAGPHPERITLDSDFDWGQNILFLNEAVERRHIDALPLCTRKDGLYNAAILVRATIFSCPQNRIREGWIAVSRAYASNVR